MPELNRVVLHPVSRKGNLLAVSLAPLAIQQAVS